ncbi:DinB family protein [Paenibacillus sp. BK720]|uniref:DinB family protein n=1 Tax=Paenibacillus sp. BK720 TaxID=2587092 RepID=UPI0014228201|nr:DinB family protein [Paenibacillus sp. BK720]NIK67768.1 putative damage-inducible protein DinB [Paenibacillus sp. BK720]
MNKEFNRMWLIRKFEEIMQRILKALNQLDDVQVNWSPGPNSHSISTLIRHMEGNILERVNKGILFQDMVRDRDAELKPAFLTCEVLTRTIQERFQFVIDTVRTLSDEQLEQTQPVRGKERSNLDMLHQCATHYSEHMGQIFYVAKQLLKDDYQSTSI